MYILTILVFLITAYFRLMGLSYSDFQGDEVSAQKYLFHNGNFLDFIFSRTIGPGQFIISKVCNIFFLNNNPEFYVRLPFAIAGILLVVVTYFFVRRFFNNRASLLTAVFLSLSGLLIAFSRIVQYQSFVMLLSICCIFSVSLYVSTKSKVYLYITSFLSALSFLFHYDSLSFIIPILLILFINSKDRMQDILKYLNIFYIVSSFFYIPFLFSPNLRETIKYLVGLRITSRFSTDNIYNSLKLLSLYHSREFLIFMGILLFIWGVGFFKRLKLDTRINTKTKIKMNINVSINKDLILNRVLRISFLMSILLIIARVLMQERNNILLFLSIFTSVIFFISYVYYLFTTDKKKKLEVLNIVELWFLFSFISYIVVITKSLTHFYNFIIPFCILISIEVVNLIKLRSVYEKIFLLSLSVVLVSTFSFNYFAFIDTNPEYPWNEKNYVFGKMPKSIAKQEEIKGVFGFPYNRGWRAIEKNAKILKEEYGYEYYDSNEKERITMYYLSDFKRDKEKVNFYIYIDKPQSLE